MLKVTMQHNAPNALGLIEQVHIASIKSSHYYSGYAKWFADKFVPSYSAGGSSILSAHCKEYNTLIGFCLLKHEPDEVKISNLSPLINGVGVAQCLLEGCDLILAKDYDIHVPAQATALLNKLENLGFDKVSSCLSSDGTVQYKLSKARNISWI